jgi:hypothetical protein
LQNWDALELDKAIEDITNNPSKWKSYYLPKLREFVASVDILPEDHPNYLYKAIVVGTRETIDKKAEEGIINRFWRQMEEKFNAQQQAQTSLSSSQNQPTLSGSTSTINNSQTPTQNTDDSVIVESSENHNEVLDAENDDSNFSNNNTEIVAKLAQLKQLRDAGVITEEVFKVQEKEILDSYF